MSRFRDSLSGLGVLLFLAGLMLAIRLLAGCTPSEVHHVENAAAVAQYDQMLAACQTEAAKFPPAERFPAYQKCERATSRGLCEESPELRETWARCKQVMP